MKTKIMKCLALVLAMTCILCFPTPASAAAQGTDGTELEVVQPEQLEIQLGESWAGVAFELKTDAGMYPGVILVGEGWHPASGNRRQHQLHSHLHEL